MPQPSLARDFFDRITTAADPVAAIRSLINSDPPTVETDWLDFKGEFIKQTPRQREEDIKRLWSKALGGFSNNEGGVLIWGVDARKVEVNGSEIDAASSESPMREPLALASRLTELQRGATDPPTANVEIKAYELPEKPEGFVVCFIPAGPFKPYRSEQAGPQWYLRAGDNFVVMSRSVLQTMFYPRIAARFRIRADLTWHRRALPNQNVSAEVIVLFQLKNEGPATGKSPFIQIEVQIDDPMGTLKCFPEEGWTSDPPPHWSVATFRPVHPGAFVRFVWFEWSTATRPLQDQPSVFVPSCPKAAFTLRVFAEDQPAQVFKVEFGEQAFVDAKAKTIEARPIESEPWAGG